MSFLTAIKASASPFHVQLILSSHVSSCRAIPAPKSLFKSLETRITKSTKYQSSWNLLRQLSKNPWKPKRISSLPLSATSQAIHYRAMATHVETSDTNIDLSKPYKSHGYHCTACNYESKMPIFICNACHALDPKGGSTASLNSSLFPSANTTHKTAGAALEDHQHSNFVPKSKKCPHQDSLPCSICDPIVTNSLLSPDEKLKMSSSQHKCDYFDFFSCPHKFNMDDAQLKKLTNRYRELQLVLHPDVHSSKIDTTPADLMDAQQQSAAIADAYRTLRNPYERAIYLLRLHGIDIERLSESQYQNMLGATANENARPNMDQLKAQEQAMLFHVMEVRETLEESSNMDEIKDILISSAAQIDECLHSMESAFEKKDLFDARHRTVLLNYLSKIQQEAELKLESLQEKA
jgi:molecular chaperone HscB